MSFYESSLLPGNSSAQEREKFEHPATQTSLTVYTIYKSGQSIFYSISIVCLSFPDNSKSFIATYNNSTKHRLKIC